MPKTFSEKYFKKRCEELTSELYRLQDDNVRLKLRTSSVLMDGKITAFNNLEAHIKKSGCESVSKFARENNLCLRSLQGWLDSGEHFVDELGNRYKKVSNIYSRRKDVQNNR